MTVMTEFQRKLSDLLPAVELRFFEPMAKHTSFRIGGAVEVMAFPSNPTELSELMKVSALLDTKPAILGAGTNVLAPDEGMDGLVICLKDCLEGMEQLDDTTIRVMGGVTMTRAAVFAANLGLSGLEFAHGIPGTVGGGVYMNAGAYGGELKDVVISTDYITADGEIKTMTEHNFGYRTSAFKDTDNIILESTMKLSENCYDEIRQTMADLAKRRQDKQPINLPSAGSTFKRPEGYFAGKLIEDAGLRGFRIGGACVSEKHCGFVVNDNNATFSDVYSLIRYIKEAVYKNSGVMLEEEVKICGL